MIYTSLCWCDDLCAGDRAQEPARGRADMQPIPQRNPCSNFPHILRGGLAALAADSELRDRCNAVHPLSTASAHLMDVVSGAQREADHHHVGDACASGWHGLLAPGGGAR